MPKVQLLELQAANLGPIADARLEFSPGFNVLTGETGAGKTLLVGALTLCLGASDARGLRHDANLRASALFLQGDTEISFARDAVAGGRLRSSIDALTASAQALRESAKDLLVVHGQHDSIRLRSRHEALRLIDEFGEIDDSELQAVRRRLRSAETLLEGLGGDDASRGREAEFLRFQIAEIEKTAPTSEDELLHVLERLRSLTAIRDSYDELVSAIANFDGDSDDALLTRWAANVRGVPQEGSFGFVRRRLEELAVEARELVRELDREASSWSSDPEELDRLEVRASELQTLARKYGGSLADVFAQWSIFQKRLDALEASDATAAAATAELTELSTREAQLSQQLLVARQKAARDFVRAVQRQFSRVALTGATLHVDVSSSDGSHVEFQFSASENVVPGPLHAMASGGELARVLLAISLETVGEGVVAVFDEVDAGVGGAVAQQIGECLRELSERQQVIVVTHLASIASLADRHFVIEKTSRSDTTVTDVRVVEGEQRVSEIARMLAGDTLHEQSRALAKNMLGLP